MVKDGSLIWGLLYCFYILLRNNLKFLPGPLLKTWNNPSSYAETPPGVYSFLAEACIEKSRGMAVHRLYLLLPAVYLQIAVQLLETRLLVRFRWFWVVTQGCTCVRKAVQCCFPFAFHLSMCTSCVPWWWLVQHCLPEFGYCLAAVWGQVEARL